MKHPRAANKKHDTMSTIKILIAFLLSITITLGVLILIHPILILLPKPIEIIITFFIGFIIGFITTMIIDETLDD